MTDSLTPKQLTDSHTRKARQLTLLGIILQSLHILFGITAIIGVIVTQTKINSTRDTVYYSQLKWQFITFWLVLIGYGVGFHIWHFYANPIIVVLVLIFAIYRISVSIQCWRRKSIIHRLI